MKIVFSADFDSDLARQTKYLIASDRMAWAERLIDEIADISETLLAHPEIGSSEPGMPAVRRVVMPSLPFVLRYHWAKREKKIVVLRLFHARQRRP